MKKKEINYKSRKTLKKGGRKKKKKKEGGKEKKLNLIERDESCNETEQQNTTMNTMIIERVLVEWMGTGIEIMRS